MYIVKDNLIGIYYIFGNKYFEKQMTIYSHGATRFKTKREARKVARSQGLKIKEISIIKVKD